MSRHYSKPFGRKVGNVCTTSIQFDKLFKENSNRPSAAKSAGTVGKWGITSFTSIRSTNASGSSISVGKRVEGVVGVKRGRTDSQNSKSNDSFSFDNDSDSSAPPIVKPKKFFKSRNAEPTPLSQESKLPNVANYGTSVQDDIDHPIRPMRTAASRKMLTRTPSPQGQRASCSAPSEESKPPIVLRIFKGTSQLVTTPTTPTSSDGDFDAHLYESPDLTTTSKNNPRSRQTSLPRSKRGRDKRERSPDDDEEEEEMILRVNTATSRAQRYSRRQAALENSENQSTESRKTDSRSSTSHDADAQNIEIQSAEIQSTVAQGSTPPSVSALSSSTPGRDTDSEPIPFIPTPKKAARYGRSFENTETEATSNYNLYMSPEPAAPTDSSQSSHEETLSQSNPLGNCSAQENFSSSDLPYEYTNVQNEGTSSAHSAPTSVVPPAVTHPSIFDEDNTDSLAVDDELSPQNQQGEHGAPFQSTYQSGPFQSGPSYDSASYQPAALNQPFGSVPSPPCNPSASCSEECSSEQRSSDDQHSEHLTARERYTRRTRQAVELATTTTSVPEEGSGDNSDAYSAPESTNGAEVAASNNEAASNHSSASFVPRKKGSIFKSRAQGSEDNKKRALYKHKWSDNQDGSGPSTSQPGEATAGADGGKLTVPKPSGSSYNIDDEFGPDELTRVTSYSDSNIGDGDSGTVTSVKCMRNTKGYYTVVRNVKKAHQIQESGEFQEFNDDVEYILDALQEQNPIGTRCLSAITLASKCMVPAFRMHVRAHGTVARFFRALHDSARDQSLGLCTATVMFALSQDRLNMDLDRDSLELMLNLLESDASHRNALEDCGLSSAQLRKNKQKVKELCAEIQSQGHAKHLNLDNITVGQLAMETLLSLTSRRAGEWFKEELRELGGLEHIVRTICQCCSQIDDYVVSWSDTLLDRLRKIDRCLRVLENVTQENEENQMYLLRYQNGALVDVLVRLMRLCGNEVPLYPVYDEADKESTGVVIREALFAVLKVLINVSHDFKGQIYGSTLVGGKEGLLESSLHMLLHIPNYIVEGKKFDLTVLALTLLINLMEHNADNRVKLVNAKAPAEVESVFPCNQKGAVEALIQMFYRQEECARNEEAKTDAILDGKDTADEKEKQDKAKSSAQHSNKSQDDFIEETIAKLLAKAGRHMEHTFVAAYIGLLLGYVIMNNKTHEDMIRSFMPERNFKIMVVVLRKFLNFLNLTVTATGGSQSLRATDTVIRYMAKIDEPPAEEVKSEPDLPSDDLDGSISS